MTRNRAPEHTQLRQWPYGNKLLTTVHHVDQTGEETVEITGVHDKLDLSIVDEAADRGHEMVLPERARRAHPPLPGQMFYPGCECHTCKERSKP